MILLVDCNNFFVSCEQLNNPSLKGLAVCVLSNNDGCIVARSNEAKDLGIPMGMPYFMAKKKFKNVTYISGNLAKYGAISKRIMTKLKEYTPSVETYSIDEAFLNTDGVEKLHKMSSFELGDKIRKEIKENIGIEVSIGVSKTKTLAKIASEIAKNNTRRKVETKYEGVFQINEENLNTVLCSTPIEEVWGVGRNLHKFFRKHNIRNAISFVEQKEDFIQRNLGKKGVELQKELEGISIYPVVDCYVPPKSISRTSSFKNFSEEFEFIKNELNAHLHKICIQLRRHNMSTECMSVMLRTKDFIVTSEKINFNTPKNSEFELYKTMHELFALLYKKGVIYRSSGISVSKLSKTEDVQMGLFVDESKSKKQKLSLAWDKIEQKFGYGALTIGLKDKK